MVPPVTRLHREEAACFSFSPAACCCCCWWAGWITLRAMNSDFSYFTPCRLGWRPGIWGAGLAFVINAVTIAKIKLELRQRHELSAKLEAARQTLRAAARVLPCCPLCGKAHPQTGRDGPAELRDLARGNADLSGALCGECAHPGGDGDGAAPHQASS